MQIGKTSSRKRAYRNRNRNSVRITVLLFVLVHLAFYLTGFLPDKGKYTCSDFRTPQPLSAYKTVELIRWDYSPDSRVMELAFDLKSTSYSEGSMEFTALYDNTKNLDSQVVYNRQDMIIIQLYGVPQAAGKKITVTFLYTPEEEKTSEAAFSSYTGVINEVDSLPVLSQDEYYLARQDDDIAYYQGQIDRLEQEIAKNKDTINSIRKDMERLRGNTENLTTDELLNLNKVVENDQSRIETLEGKNKEYQLKIASHRETITVLEKRKEDYERTDK